MRGDAVGTELARADHHMVAQGYGGVGIVEREDQVDGALARAKELAAAGTPVVVNVHLGSSDFRTGSISM